MAKFSSPIEDAALFSKFGDAHEILHSEVEESVLATSGKNNWYDLANATKDLDLKVRYYTETLKKNHQSFHAFINRAKALNTLGNYKEALDDAENAIILEPGEKLAFEVKATALFGLNRIDEAEEVLKDELNLQLEFELLDKDRDGFITIEDLKDWPQDTASEWIRDRDHSGDGKVSLSEFIKKRRIIIKKNWVTDKVEQIN